ncbi:ras and Rab interactor 2 [Brachionichthys hirsutus]|uniref:ras and Rab interactor 2 n=1 Tax=Brachionichthys hirsutus TaxID=412623 RepID=UPI003604E5D7
MMAVHSSVNGATAIPWRSSRKRLSLLEQLRVCQDAWCPGARWDREGAHSALRGTPAGSFLLVRDSATSQPSLLCVSAGENDDAVLDYDIRSTDTVFQLSESRLSFSDLAQLVLFYSLTRDVLALCLSIPHWICSVTERNKDYFSPLKPKTWLCTPLPQRTEKMTQREPSSVLWSIQMTSTTGALCVINPLYLHEHGDDWLTHRTSAACCTNQPPNYRRERRLSSSRMWAGAGLQRKRAISLDEEQPSSSQESSGPIRAKSSHDLPSAPLTPATPNPPDGVLLRETSRNSASRNLHRTSTGSLHPSSHATPGLQPQVCPVLQSPHRVSWIEDGVWLPPPRPSSVLEPPLLELDSFSLSSVEDEQDSQLHGPSLQHSCAQTLADKVKHRLSAVGQALSGLLSQRKRLTNRVQELSERKGERFCEAAKGFVEMALKRGADLDGVILAEFLQEVRLAFTSLMETLLDSQEIQALLDSLTDIEGSEMDLLVELSLQKVALKPVSAHLYSCIHALRTDDGTVSRLQSNLCVLEKKGIDELGGSGGVGVPDPVNMKMIQQNWTSLHEAYSPNKKVQILLDVCKIISDSMSANANSGTVYGADHFLPCLTWVLVRSDVVTLQVDTDYMMELLDPVQLQGEGGYYLTSLYASLYYISSFQPRQAARQLSVEAEQSINQWHRRRTQHCRQSRCSVRKPSTRRQLRCDEGMQNPETRSKEEREKRSDCVSDDEGGSQTATPVSDWDRTDMRRGEEEEKQALWTVDEEDNKGTQHREEIRT